MAIEQVSLQELKRRLSHLIQRAAAGERIVITRHRRPLAELRPVGGEAVKVGPRFGAGLAGPLLRGAARGRALQYLREDREAER